MRWQLGRHSRPGSACAEGGTGLSDVGPYWQVIKIRIPSDLEDARVLYSRGNRMRRRPRSRTRRVDPGYRPRRTRARPRDKLKSGF